MRTNFRYAAPALILGLTWLKFSGYKRIEKMIPGDRETLKKEAKLPGVYKWQKVGGKRP